MSALALLAWLAPAVGGLMALVAGGRAAQAAVYGPALTAGVGAVALAGASITPLDPLAGLMLVLVGGVTLTVQSYALRQLRGAGGARATTALLGIAATAGAVFVSAESLLAMAAAWTVAGVAFLGVLAAHRALPSGRDALRRAATAFAIADVALWAAVVLDLTGAQPGSGAGDLAALLLVVAAAARAAQLPLQGWLVTTIAAPTPVCAFLHAGVVNAGGILLLRQQELLTASTAAMGAAIGIGAVTMLGAAVAMATRSDVKGILACSTSAQMGFMLLTCGIGAWAATVIHIVGHAMYKAASLLGAGSAIAAHARRRAVPAAPAQRRTPARDAVIAAAAPAAGLAAIATLMPEGKSTAALLIFAWLTGAAALWSALRRANRPGEQTLAAAAAAAASAAYLAAASGLATLLALPSAAGHPAAWLALVPLAAAGLALAAWSRGGSLRDRLYIRAMRLGTPRPAGYRTGAVLPRALSRPAAVTAPSTALPEGGAA